MLRYILDTNICIYVLKNYPEELRGRFNREADHLCISTITLAELQYGAEKSARPPDNLRKVEEFAARLEVMPFGAKAAMHFGEIRFDLERAGTPIGAYDMLIGAQARSEGLIVVTSNRREFDRIPGLRVESWI